MTAELRVLMVGDSLNQRGGIATLQKAHLGTAPDHIHTTHVATHDEGSRTYRMMFFVKALRRVSQMFSTGSFDVVHVHQSGGGSLIRKALIVMLAHRREVPTVLHGHAGWSDSTLLRLPGVLRWFVVRNLGKVDAVIALSSAWAVWYNESIGVPDERIRVIHTPAPPVLDAPPAPRGEQTRIISVSRLREEKGTFDLLRAFAELPSDVQAGSELVLAGDGDLVETRELAISLGISDNVRLLGWVEGAELTALLRSADIFVSASHHEGIPLSLLEALSEGLASISTNVGGIPEIVTDGRDCLLVSPQSPVELREAMMCLLVDVEMRDRISAGALEASSNNDAAHYWDGILDVYAAATGGRSTGADGSLPSANRPLGVGEVARVSIVVPTFNRAAWLGEALDSLMTQKKDELLVFEIVVVDNASTDFTAAVVADAEARSPVPIRYVYEPVQGDGAARNSGILAAAHDLIAFFDDDQFAATDWISALVDVVRSTGAMVVGGAVTLDLDADEHNRFGLVTRRDMLRESVPYDRVRAYEHGELPGTCNLLVARQVFDVIGVFDATMNGGSDFDLLRRANRAGFEAWFAPEASVVHRVGRYRRTTEYFQRESRRNGWGLAEQTLTDNGRSTLLFECVARLAQAGLVNGPLFGLATLRRDGAEAIDRRVLLWRAEGFLRRTSADLVPWVWSQEQFRETHQFAGHESQQIEREPAE